MLYNSIDFLVFFPMVVLIYFVVPRRVRWLWLLITSLVFYAYWSIVYTLLLLIEIVITYSFGRVTYKLNHGFRKKTALICGIGIVSSTLLFFKYSNFFITLVNRFVHTGFSRHNLLMPLGISFFSFKMIGYLIDLYRGKAEPERNILKLALYISFFPEMVAGPISRAQMFLVQSSREHHFDYRRIKKGLVMMLFGIFQKIVIADRLAMMVDKVYDTPQDYYGFTIIYATILFSFQIYADFASYSMIAVGCAKIFGYIIPKNFNQPYLSISIKEFWHRWHISLSTWFRDYLYFPLGGGRCPRWKKYLNIMIVFLVSGIWHGASVTFFMWGILHGSYHIIAELTQKIRTSAKKRIKIEENCLLDRMWRRSIIFACVTFAWIFFRANDLTELKILFNHLCQFNPWVLVHSETMMLNLNFAEYFVAIIGVLFLIMIDFFANQGGFYMRFERQHVLFRWSIYTILLSSCLVLGVYGPEYSSGQFIYAGF